MLKTLLSALPYLLILAAGMAIAIGVTMSTHKGLVSEWQAFATAHEYEVVTCPLQLFPPKVTGTHDGRQVTLSWNEFSSLQIEVKGLPGDLRVAPRVQSGEPEAAIGRAIESAVLGKGLVTGDSAFDRVAIARGEAGSQAWLTPERRERLAIILEQPGLTVENGGIRYQGWRAGDADELEDLFEQLVDIARALESV